MPRYTNTEYDIVKAFEAIENELIASLINNLDRHRAEEVKEGYNWTQWQAVQLAALDEYKRHNAKKYNKQFKNINGMIEQLISEYRAAGETDQEIEILEAIKKGFKAHKSKPGMTGEFFKVNNRKMDALIDATIHDLEKAEHAILRMANDKYRKTIFNAQVYAASGATYTKAVDMATRDFVAAGLNCVEYKNGARHTLSSYANMAIRTANKRAYLTGEGESRRSRGISTVIVNKQSGPCPLCLPFMNKILIDDVWSGGQASDGPYPLMSTAIAAGLYHPNCEDIHSTFFEGIDDEPDATWTKEEIAEIEKNVKLNTQKKNAERQYERCSRLAKYSLDEDNKRIYKHRAEQWKSKKETLEKDGETSIIRVYKSVGAAGKKYPVKLPDSKQHTKLVEGQTINGVTFAGKGTNKEIRERYRLESTYKVDADKWEKVSGKGMVIVDGKAVKAELHWYKADDQIVEMKVKRYLDES